MKGNMKASGKKGFGSMSRRGFLKGVGLAAAGVGAASLGLGGVANAQIVPTGLDSCEVHPIGSASKSMTHPVFGIPCTEDVFNIQAAVSLFRYVVLKAGIFEFGEAVRLPSPPYGPYDWLPGGVVLIPSPVTIVGDGLDASGDPKSRILHGGGLFTLYPDGPAPFAAFTIVHDVYAPQPGPGTIKIQGLKFEGQTLSCLGAFLWDKVEIRDNLFVNTNSQTITPNIFPNQPFYFNVRFSIGAVRQDLTEDNIQPHLGSFIVENNVIHNSEWLMASIPEGPFDPEYVVEVDAGMSLAHFYDDLKVLNNTVSNLGRGIVASDNYYASVVDSNHVTGYDISQIETALLCSCNKNMLVTNNTIELKLMPDLPSYGFGSVFSTHENQVLDVIGNRFVMETGTAAMHLGDPGFCFFSGQVSLQHSMTKNNQFTGTATYVMIAVDHESDASPDGVWHNDSNNNEVVGNNMATFSPLGPYIVLGPYTYDNVFRGYFGEGIVNLGSNYITGSGLSMKDAGGVGQAMSAAMHEKILLRADAMGALFGAMGNAAQSAAKKLNNI